MLVGAATGAAGAAVTGVAAVPTPPVPEAPDGPGVYGVLTDRDGVALAGVALAVLDAGRTQLTSTTSDRNGRYQVALPGAGEYLLVTQSGREPTAEWVAVAGGPARRDLCVEGTADLTGEVRSASGSGVAALVTVVDQRGEVIAGVRADAAGRYRVEGLPAGDHHLLVSPPDGETIAQRVVLPSTGTVCHDVTLAVIEARTGTVRSGRGREVHGPGFSAVVGFRPPEPHAEPLTPGSTTST